MEQDLAADSQAFVSCYSLRHPAIKASHLPESAVSILADFLEPGFPFDFGIQLSSLLLGADSLASTS